MDGRAYGTNREDVYGRRLGADGSRQGGDIRIASAGNTATDQNHPDVAGNSNTGGYLIVWTDWRNSHSGAVDDRGSDTYARRLNADGSRSGGEFRVASGNATANEDDPAVAFERGLYGGYLPVWSDARWAATAAQEIVGRLVVP
jgi:hypothetical protein